MSKENEDADFIEKQARKFSQFRRTSYVWDTHDLLDEKDSPIDKGYKVWNYLLKWKRNTLARIKNYCRQLNNWKL